jgi:hypothetical protein
MIEQYGAEDPAAASENRLISSMDQLRISVDNNTKA